MSRRVQITLTFSADLDWIPGWGHEPEDWVELIQSELMRNGHYHPAVEIQKVSIPPSTLTVGK